VWGLLNTISAELLKYKRGKLFLFFIIVMAIYTGCILSVLPSPRQVLQISFLGLFTDAFSFVILIHLMVLGLLATTIFSIEYRHNTIRQLFTIPVSAKQFLFAKIFIVMIFSILLMFGFAISLTLVGFITGAVEMTAHNVGMVFAISLTDAITMSIAIIPILFVMIISKQNFLLPIIAVFVYTLIILLPNMGMVTISNDLMAYIFPLGSMAVIHNTLVYNSFSPVLPVTMPTADWRLCIICLCLFAIIFSVMSVLTLKKQEH